MGYLKDKLIEQEERVEQALRDLPDTLEKSHKKIKMLSQELITLRNELRELHSTWEKWKGYIIGGVIGAVLGVLIAQLLKFL